MYNEQHYKQKAQIAGTAAHEAIDNKSYSTRAAVLQSIEIYSEKYNIVGKIDLFDQANGRLTERKKEIKVIYDGYVFQVYAQYFGLSEMGYKVNEIIIYDLSHNKKYPIPLPQHDMIMFQKFEQVITNLQKYDLQESSFVPNIQKCNRCIYSPLCDKSLC